MSAIYAVFGRNGEYSSHEEWAVCFYTEEAPAILHAERLKAAAQTIVDGQEDDDYWDLPWGTVEKYAEAMGDGGHDADRVGADYFVMKIQPGVLPMEIPPFSEWVKKKKGEVS